MPTKAKPHIDTKELTKWRKLFTPPIAIALALISLCLVMTVICFVFPSIQETSVTSPVENLTSLESITPGDKVVQKFTSDGNYTRFGLYYANYSNYYQGGKLHINIKDSHGNSEDFTYNIGGITDNTFMYINHPLEEHETYTLTIHITDGAQSITFFTTTSKDNYDAELLINQKPQTSSIVMAFVSEVEDRFTVWYYIMAISLILCYIVLKIDKDVYAK